MKHTCKKDTIVGVAVINIQCSLYSHVSKGLETNKFKNLIG